MHVDIISGAIWRKKKGNCEEVLLVFSLLPTVQKFPACNSALGE